VCNNTDFTFLSERNRFSQKLCNFQTQIIFLTHFFISYYSNSKNWGYVSLACCNFVITISLLNYCKMNSSVICVFCWLLKWVLPSLHPGLRVSLVAFGTTYWFYNLDYFSCTDIYDWLELDVIGSQTLTFSAGVQWPWRYCNLVCLNNGAWSLSRLSFNIKVMVQHS
jgi:hypothetical protein